MTLAHFEWRNGDRTAIVDVGADETILEAAEAAGLSLPFGCRRGTCGTCTARLLEGEVTHERPTRALKERHRVDGYVLTCIASPLEEVRLEVGATVQADLVSNPWK